MIRLFKHYIPHAVLLLGVCDAVALLAAAEIGWVVRAHQIGIAVGPAARRSGIGFHPAPDKRTIDSLSYAAPVSARFWDVCHISSPGSGILGWLSAL